MAVEQINSAAFDYDMMLSFIEGTNIGKAEITISEFDSTAAPVVKVGSKFEVNGALFKVLTADETPSGYSGIAISTTFYIMYDVSGGEFVFTSVAPSWNDALQGWYETGETDRYFFSMFKDSGGTLYGNKIKISNNGDISLRTTILEIGDWNMDADTYSDVAHGLADFKKIRTVTIHILNDADDEIVNLMTSGIDIVTRQDPLGGIYEINSTNVRLGRIINGDFDNTNFNATSFNRGWVTIEYVE